MVSRCILRAVPAYGVRTAIRCVVETNHASRAIGICTKPTRLRYYAGSDLAIYLSLVNAVEEAKARSSFRNQTLRLQIIRYSD
jgi:hypothetical protein